MSEKYPHLDNAMAYKKTVVCANAVLQAKASGDGALHPVQIRLETGAGGKGHVALEAKGDRNVFEGEFASLPIGCDTLVARFDMKVVPAAVAPHNSSSVASFKQMRQVFEDLVKDGAVDEICRLIAGQIASGSWLWRNRDEALRYTVTVSGMGIEQPMVFEHGDSSGVDALSRLIADAATGRGPRQLLAVKAELLMGDGSPVYPSQLFEAGHKLYQITDANGEKQAAMRGVKVGNALRTIDSWYPDYDELGVPISVEPLGVSLRFGEALRTPTTGVSAYDVLNAVMDPNGGGLAAIQADRGKVLYLTALLLRGALFAEEKEKDAAAPATAKKTKAKAQK